MADRFFHPDGRKAQRVRLRGKRLIRQTRNEAGFTNQRTEEQERQAGRMTGKGTQAGSYSKERRKGYEDMLEEAGKIYPPPPPPEKKND